jgi:hypothetical protein
MDGNMDGLCGVGSDFGAYIVGGLMPYVLVFDFCIAGGTASLH